MNEDNDPLTQPMEVVPMPAQSPSSYWTYYNPVLVEMIAERDAVEEQEVVDRLRLLYDESEKWARPLERHAWALHAYLNRYVTAGG